MRLLVFSDLHGNADALRELIKVNKLKEFDRIVFLGDIFGYYYNQEDCFGLLKTLPNLVWLKGNHDAYAFRSYYGEIKEIDLIERYGHSYYNLRERFTETDMRFLGSLQSCYCEDYNGVRIGFFHGRPDDPLEGRVYNNTELTEEEYRSYDVVFFGHTHCRIDRMVGNTRIISPGSIGQPRDGKGYGYLVFETDTRWCEFDSVIVDAAKLRNQIDTYDPGLNKLYDVLAREE